MHSQKPKNFLPALIIAFSTWFLWLGIVFFQPPANNFLIFSFFSLFFLATFLTSALILGHSRRGLFCSLFLTIFLIFRYFQIANPLNLALLTAILLTFEIYLNAS